MFARWRTAVFMIVMVLVGSFAAAPPASAGPIAIESAADCERGARGFVDIPDNLTGEVVRGPIVIGTIIVELHKGYVQGLRGWAKMRGTTNNGDMVWMDWTTDGGATWVQCGPFFAIATFQTKTSAAQRTNPSTAWRFRACGMMKDIRPHRCTDWW